MIKTDRAVSREDPALLTGLAAYAGPAMVLYGEHDIFGTFAGVIRLRLPRALQVTLERERSGHLHWRQNQTGYGETLRASTRATYRDHGRGHHRDLAAVAVGHPRHPRPAHREILLIATPAGSRCS